MKSLLSTGTRQRIAADTAARQRGVAVTGYVMAGAFATAGLLLALSARRLRQRHRRGRAESDLRVANDALKAKAREEETAAIRADLLLRERAARADVELANRLRDDFLATVSHELRTPLNAIVGWVHLLKTGIADDRRRAINAIERNAAAQARLIDDLLDMAHMVKGRFTLTVAPVDLGAIAEAALETVKPAADAKHVDVIVHAEGDVVVAGEASRLQQVVWNLLSNAVKFTPMEGQVIVDTWEADGQVQLRVADTGDGIDPDFLPHVFEPFRQQRSGSASPGLGLGLTIARQIIELHGGTVTAESPGMKHGATFTVMLPRARPV